MWIERQTYAVARLRYAAAQYDTCVKGDEFAGDIAVQLGPRRRSSNYAVAARVVKRRSTAFRRRRTGVYPGN